MRAKLIHIAVGIRGIIICIKDLVLYTSTRNNSHIRNRSNNAKSIWWNKKNKGDHIKFSENWLINNVKNSGCLFLNVHIFARAYPIRRYNTVQIGPKMKLGGLKLGFIKCRYHCVSPELDRTPDNSPRLRQVSMHVK